MLQLSCETEKTLITQNAVPQVNNKGMIPIEKNISVIDENGNEYEATYPKRARGLVKKGRARFVDDNTICLACPPDIMEDTNMSDNKNVNVNVNANEETLNVGYILKQMAAIQQDNAHIYEALSTITNIAQPGPGDITGQAKATAIADIVKCRETTNQKLLAFYEKVYDDIKPSDRHSKLLKNVVTEVNRVRQQPTVAPKNSVEEVEDDSIDKAIDDAVNKAIEESISKSIEESLSQEFFETRP